MQHYFDHARSLSKEITASDIIDQRAPNHLLSWFETMSGLRASPFECATIVETIMTVTGYSSDKAAGFLKHLSPLYGISVEDRRCLSVETWAHAQPFDYDKVAADLADYPELIPLEILAMTNDSDPDTYGECADLCGAVAALGYQMNFDLGCEPFGIMPENHPFAISIDAI